jgi:hypothetical protein
MATLKELGGMDINVADERTNERRGHEKGRAFVSFSKSNK